MGPGRAALCAVLLGLTSATSAWAQSPAGGGAGAGADADLSKQATDLYNEGTKAAAKFDWEKARTFYASAWRIQKHWQIAVSLGRAELNAKKYRDAAEHLDYFLLKAPDVTPATRKEVQVLLDQAKAKVGTLTVTVDPPEAEVSVDGASVGKAPLPGPVFVEPGPRVIEAKREGFKPGKGEKTLAAGQDGKVELRLEKEAAKVAPLVPSTTAPLPLPPPEGGPNKALVIGGLAATCVGLVMGVAFAAAWQAQPAAKSNADCNGRCTYFKNTAFWSFLGAGLVGGATLTYTLVRGRSKPQNGPTVSAFASPNGGAVVFTERW